MLTHLIQILAKRSVGKADGVSDADITIAFSHHMIHSEDAYMLSYNATLAGGLDSIVRIATPNTRKWSHFEWSIQSSAAFTAYLRRDYTGAHVGGNVLTPINRNDNSNNTSGLTICHTPNGATNGDIIWQDASGADGQPVSSRPGNSTSRGELILKQNTVYLFHLDGENDDICTFNFSWYEHENAGPRHEH